MKRMAPWMSILLILTLAACGLQLPGRTPAVTTPGVATLPPDEILTIVSATLTVLPVATEELPVLQASPTPELPTLPAAVETATEEPTVAASPVETATAVPEAATATGAPTAAVTATQVPPTAAAPAGPTPTLVSGDPRNRLGPATSTDPMDNEDVWNWPVGRDQFTHGTFSNGVQVITTLDEQDGWRMANPQGRDFSNIYVEATFKTGTCAGSDHYGIILRVPVIHEPDQGYLFGATCDGKYSLRRWNGEILPRGEMKRLIDWTASSAILTGPNQTNRLGFYAVGSRLVVYINGTQVGEVQDNQFSRGYFGVFAGYDSTENLVIQVDEMSYWENPQ